MFEPEIHWHYSGRLRIQLEDAACERSAHALISALRSEGRDTRCLFVPVSSKEVFQESLKRAFKAASMSVHATEIGSSNLVASATTAYNREEADFSFVLHTGTVDEFSKQLGAKSTLNRIFNMGSQRRVDRVVLAVRGRSRLDSSDGMNLVEDCRSMARIAADRGHDVELIPEPGLSRDETLEIIRTAPSRILDGSHESEQQLERMTADSRESSPFQKMIRAAWHELKSGVDLGLLSKSVFESRVARLDESVAKGYPWEAIISFWREVLYGLESDREHASRWYTKTSHRPDGWLNLKDLNDILLYESSIYSLHAEIDPACVSYLVAYHGSRWVQTRMALNSMFSPLGGNSGPPPSVKWE